MHDESIKHDLMHCILGNVPVIIACCCGGKTNDLRDFRAKIVGAVSKNVFFKNQPHGGARRGPCEN